jgi:hypothetical protein
MGQPALIGGLVMGVLSALPIISAGNICCCLWVVAGGMVAAYVLQQNQSAPITPGDGAMVGLLAGLIGAGVSFVLSIPIGLLLEPVQREMLQRSLAMAGNMPPALREFLESYSQPRARLFGGLLVRVIGLFVMLFAGAIFSTLGGLLGAAMFKKSAPPVPSSQT